MEALLDVILPVFVVIGFGWTAARAGIFSDAAVDGLMKFAQGFAVPCLLFRSIAHLDLAAVYDTNLFLAFYLGAFSCFVLGFLGALLIFKRPLPDCVAIGFVCLFSNSLLLGLPITERAYGRDALSGNYAILSVHAPLFYAFGITIMEVVRSRGAGLSALSLGRQVIVAIFSNSLVVGIVAGFLVNFGIIPLPKVVFSGIDMLASAAIPAALFGLGGVLNRYRPSGDFGTIAMACTISLIVHPLITWALGRSVLGLTTDQLRSAVMTAAMAPGANAYMFASLYGVAMRVAASSVLIATAASIVTIWCWLQILP
ncbi:MAG: AEC family transporter [Cereibacter sphaeroides]|uniref:AEC family transporter n=1 Tax=Cereibacter sphaeroides TaxID=1063 RepID=A0A2W5SA50_CERSP|nr:MAG: AEC family transporter [Cereibacter sphaeroides]